MSFTGDGTLLRVFLGDADRHEGRALYRVLVEHAQRAGLAGATVLRGPMGFGHRRLVHSAKLAEVATDLPVVVEIVDRDEAIEAFVPELRALVPEGLVTLEKVRVIRLG